MSPTHSISQKQLAARREDLRRIAEALDAASALLPVRALCTVQVERKEEGEPVTAAERANNHLLFKVLVRNGEGWLSEEGQVDLSRLGKQRVWVVDPLDGTRE